MAGALSAATGAGAAAPPAQAVSSEAPAGSGKSSADSFLEALGLDRDPAAKPDAKAASPAKVAGAADPPDHAPLGAQQAAQTTAPDNTALAWMVNLIGGGTQAAQEKAPAAAVADDGAGVGTATEKSTAKSTAAPNAAALPTIATAAVATPTAPADPAALAASAAATAAALPPAIAASHDKAAAAAEPAPAASDVAAPTGPQTVAPAMPPPQLAIPNVHNSFASLLAQTPDPITSPSAHASLPQETSVWPAVLNEQVRWQLGKGVQEARLDLHPRDLGSVQVHLRLSAGGAEVQFSAAHPQARQALEASLPQLRALLEADGLHLAQAQVGSQSQSQMQWQAGRQRFSPADESAAEAVDEVAPAFTGRLRVVRIGLVDDYA